MNIKSILPLILAGLTSCTSGQAPEPLTLRATAPKAPAVTESHVEYEKITAGHLSQRRVSLCYLLSHYNAGAGLYNVARLVGQPETVQDTRSEAQPFTYAELELIEPWSANAPANPTVRVSGGPTQNGLTQDWRISLAKGEAVGILLYNHTAENRNFYGLHPLAVFHDDGSGYNNGQLFRNKGVTAPELGAHVSAAFKSLGQAECVDQQPDADVAPHRPAQDQQIQGQEIQLNQGEG